MRRQTRFIGADYKYEWDVDNIDTGFLELDWIEQNCEVLLGKGSDVML